MLKQLFHYVFRALCATVLAVPFACISLGEKAGEGTAGVTVCLVPEGFMQTRSNYSWKESEIRDVQVVVTSADGTVHDVLYAKSAANLQFTGIVGCDYDLWVAANLGKKIEVSRLEDFTEGILDVTSSGISSSGIPMSSRESVRVRVGKDGGEALVSLTRLMARIDLSIDYSLLEKPAGMIIKSARIYSPVNSYSPFSNSVSRTRSGYPNYVVDKASRTEITRLNYGGSASLYTFENMQGTLLPGNSDPWNKIPDNIGDASDYCTRIEVECSYENDRGSGNLTYRMYLGSDATSNFDVRRNTLYNITLIPSEGEVTGESGSWKIECEDWEYNPGEPDPGPDEPDPGPDNPDPEDPEDPTEPDPEDPEEPAKPDPELSISFNEKDTWGGNTYDGPTLLYDDGYGNVSDVTSQASFRISYSGGSPQDLISWDGRQITAADWWGRSGAWVTSSPAYTITFSYNGLEEKVSGTMHGYTGAVIQPVKKSWYYTEIEDGGRDMPPVKITLTGSEQTEAEEDDSYVIDDYDDPKYIWENGFIGVNDDIPLHVEFTDPSNGMKRSGDTSFDVQTNVKKLHVIIRTHFVQGVEDADDPLNLDEPTGRSGTDLGACGIVSFGKQYYPSHDVKIDQTIWYEDYNGSRHDITSQSGQADYRDSITITTMPTLGDLEEWPLESSWWFILGRGKVYSVEINVNGFTATWHWGHIGN